MRTLIYIDAANIILSAQRINFNLDLGKLFVYLKDRYKNCRILFFTGDVVYLKQIQAVLEEHLIEIYVKKISREGGRIKANCDVDLTNKLTIDVERNNVDFVIIMSADGDFTSLFDYLSVMEKLSKCISTTPENTSILLKRRARDIKLSYLIQIPYLEK